MDRSLITWVIDTTILRFSAVDLPTKLREAQIECLEFAHTATSSPPTLPDLTGRCVVLYGSIGFNRRIRESGAILIPGNLGNNTNTEVARYMSYLPLDWFLNRNCLMTTWSVLNARPKEEWQVLFPGTRVFARPNSGFKTFAGQTINYDKWQEDLEAIDQVSSVTGETLIVLAPDQELQGEFRFVVADGKVIAGSEYRWDNVLDIRRDWPEECFEVAKKVAEHEWQLDIAYTCDVALTPNGSKLIELNGFSSAGLYACDINAVIEGITECAWREWSGEDVEL